jgi:hypothetical protein
MEKEGATLPCVPYELGMRDNTDLASDLALAGHSVKNVFDSFHSVGSRHSNCFHCKHGHNQAKGGACVQ